MTTAPFGNWTRLKNQADGYVIGNGHGYAVVALGRELGRVGKSRVTNERASLTQIAWITGPAYGCSNLGFGWEVQVVRDEAVQSLAETVLPFSAEQPAHCIALTHADFSIRVSDVFLPEEAVFLRHLEVVAIRDLPALRLRLPVRADPRNATFTWWDGKPVPSNHAMFRPSPESAQLRETVDEHVILLRGAGRRIWQEISTPYPVELPERFLATTVSGAPCRADEQGLTIQVAALQSGSRCDLGVWIAMAWSRQGALDLLQDCRNRDARAICRATIRAVDPLIAADDDSSGLVRVVAATDSLVRAAQSACGGVFAQGYMYPMCYVRDQYGSFRFLIEAGRTEDAWRLLEYIVAMQNAYGIQNANDATLTAPTERDLEFTPGRHDGPWADAEVPSYVVLMARDCHRADGDRRRLLRLYPRLAYNLRCQRFDGHGLLASPHDESYTNIAAPQMRSQFADSCMLYVAAARFMADVARQEDRATDARDFQMLAERTWTMVMDRLWDAGAGHFVYARGHSEDPSDRDPRPALDALLRGHWIDLDLPGSAWRQGCLKAVLNQLTNPLRIVPNKTDCTGMDAGYLLAACAVEQHPLLHEAAELLAAYASELGTFCEYYAHSDGMIHPYSGNLRPWESAVNGAAILRYLLGATPDVPANRLGLRPHLPPGWRLYTSSWRSLGRLGQYQVACRRDAGQVTVVVRRRGGVGELEVTVELGGLGPLGDPPAPWRPVADRPNVVFASQRLAGDDSAEFDIETLIPKPA
jgi:hypothetical protein